MNKAVVGPFPAKIQVGYPERFAQEALGHNSKAVHRAYAKRAQMKIPSLENYEQRAVAKEINVQSSGTRDQMT
jgi:hypothetical protein